MTIRIRTIKDPCEDDRIGKRAYKVEDPSRIGTVDIIQIASDGLEMFHILWDGGAMGNGGLLREEIVFVDDMHSQMDAESVFHIGDIIIHATIQTQKRTS